MWFIPTRNRPELMLELIESIKRSGDTPDVAVMVDGEPYDIAWPQGWHIHVSSEHLEFQRAFNELLKLHPNENTYGILTDHARPETPGWSRSMEAEAGDWNAVFCDDIRNRINPKSGLKRVTSASCYGGELIRSLGYIWPDFCVHLYGDDALEELVHELGIIKHSPVIVKDLHFIEGEIKQDSNHERIYQGIPYAENDRLAFYKWKDEVKPNLIKRLRETIPSECIGDSPERITIVCVQAGNYQGCGSLYVNNLYDMILRNVPVGLQYRFICFTDNTEGLDGWIENKPLPEANLKGWWNKLSLFKKGVLEEGEQVFFFDLDTLVISALDEIFTYRGSFCALSDFYRRSYLGSGLMSWKPEDNYDIWDKWVAAGKIWLSAGDQTWIQQIRKTYDKWQEVFPEKVISYKSHCKPYPTQNASIVCFHGEPRPHNCTQNWVQDIWKVGGTSALNLTVVPNMSDNSILDNIKKNSDRAKWLINSPEHEQVAVICGSGPSLIDDIETIKEYVENGAIVFCLNNSANVLRNHGIVVNYQVILDARKGNDRLINHEANAYLIASQCDPDVFDALEDKIVCLWHPMIDGVGDLFPDRNLTLVGGGTTVGLSSMALVYTMGFRKIALFGYDSSFKDGKMHATPQPQTDTEKWTFDVTVGDRTFSSNAAMAKQAELFPLLLNELVELDCEIRVYGEGLLPYISELYAAQTLTT